ncbi:hypothetical protein [uncultured Chryseobacterium sp.]|uniref:hypothetical protein n=1 Tax=uncultured Chryseobacterium sp. TaxID=259322 RepID=UPI0025F84E70|nr:hypothetical protein [uncultured Chryseobacterium sp.]
MFEKRKLLLKTAYERAKKEIKEEKNNKSIIFGFLSLKLEEKFGESKDARTFVRYYNRLINDNRDYDIDGITLDQLSWYIGYKNFEDFCDNYVIERDRGDTQIQLKIDHDEESLSEKLSKIIINITNTPIFNVPQLAKNGIGIGLMSVILVLGMNFKDILKDKNLMYWDGNEYKLTSEGDKNPNRQLLPVDTVRLKYFKKITRPDTLTIDNALGNTYYSKKDNEVEFFTMGGINPNNGKGLKQATEYMLTRYAGIYEE